MKMHIKTGDLVKVLSGKDKGKQGIILKVYPKTRRAIVQGINVVTKRIKSDNTGEPGKIETKEMPLHACKLQFIDPTIGKPTRIGRKKNENNKWQRYSIKTGNFI